jgi:glycosyltransferase involved in cell wall biosynthesis
LKILLVTQTYDPFLERGGPTIKVRSMAEGLVRRGHRVTVLTSWFGRPFTARHTVLNGVEVVYLRPMYTYRATTLNSGLRDFCKRRLPEFNVVHIFGLYDVLGPVIAHHAYRLKIPYLIEPLGMTRPIDRNLMMKRGWHIVFGKPMFRHAARIIGTSQQERQELLDLGWPAEKIVLRYNGVDLDEFSILPPYGAFRKEWAISDDEPVVLFLGRLIPRKGVDLLINSFAAACPQRGRLVVAGPEGEAHYVKQLRELARSKGVEARTIFTGALYGDQKKSVLVDCDVFALPSRYENFANSVAEAIACGKPVVVSDRCGISEFVNGSAGLVIPRDQNALTESLTSILSDRVLYDKLRSACPDVAARLSWNQLLGAQESLYDLARATPQKP